MLWLQSEAEGKTVMGRDMGIGVTDKRGRPQQQWRADTKCVLKGPLGATLEVITALLQNISIQSNYTQALAAVQLKMCGSLLHGINAEYFTLCINITQMPFWKCTDNCVGKNTESVSKCVISASLASPDGVQFLQVSPTLPWSATGQ